MGRAGTFIGFPWPRRRGFAALLALVVCLWGPTAVPAGGGPRPWNAATPPEPVERPARGVLLVAAESLQDPNFARSVVLLVDYDRDGPALGLVINRRARLPLTALVPDLDAAAADAPDVYLGGPVGLGRVTLLIRSGQAPVEAAPVLAGVYISASMTTLEQLMAGRPPEAHARAFVGHAGWARGQLDREIGRGDWHLVRAAEEHVFAADGRRLWERLIAPHRGRWVHNRPPQPSPRSVSTWNCPPSSIHTLNSMEAQHTGQSS